MRTHEQTQPLLACPICGVELTRSAHALECLEGHVFPTSGGIPRLIPASEGDVGDIHESFSREWSHFDYDRDRTWGQTVEQRRAVTLTELDTTAEELAGKLVLDAGCGTGVISAQLAELGARVVACDISRSVEAAHARFGGLGIDFLQADLNHPPFRPGSFDVVFSGGVLHHNRDTRAALEQVAQLVAPGGSIYVWLYWQVPGPAYRLKSLLRRVVAPMPSPVKHAFVRAWLVQALARRELRKLTGRARPEDELSWREKLVILLDHYTPRYRWEHTPEELAGWYRELGFVEPTTTFEGKWGFGVLARRPLEAPVARAAVAAATAA